MKIKRIASLLIAVLLMFSFSFNSFAVLGKEDPNNLEEGISFVDSVNENENSKTIQQIKEIKRNISDKSRKIFDALTAFWNSYGLLTIVIVLVLCIVIATAVYIYEKKKLKKIKKQNGTNE